MKTLKSKKRILWILRIHFILLISCTPDPFNAESAAEEYCECMKKNNSPVHYEYATAICDAELIKKNRYYKLFTIDLAHEYLANDVSLGTVDSTQKFMQRFDRKLNETCCRAVLRCPETNGN